MEKHELAKLESKIKGVADTLRGLAPLTEPHAAATGLLDLLNIIHKPGWTTVADGIFVNGILDSMSVHARALSGLQETLISGARAVGQK
jgi:hypothetical protein